MEDPAEEANRLFLHNTVNDSLDYLNSLTRTITESSHSLRSLIGDSEGALLTACERVSDMQASSAAILSVRERLRHAPTHESGTHSARDAPHSASTSADLSSPLATVASAVSAAEAALSALHAADAVVRSQLVNVESLLLSHRSVAACGALKEVHGLLRVCRSLPEDILATLTSPDVVAAADTLASAQFTQPTRSQRVASASSVEADMLSEETTPPAAPPSESTRLWERRARVLHACTDSTEATATLEAETAQYEVALLRTVRQALWRRAGDAAMDTIVFLRTAISNGAPDLRALAALSSDGEHSSATDAAAQVRARHYMASQQKRQSTMTRYLSALFVALEDISWSDTTRRWLESLATTTAASLLPAEQARAVRQPSLALAPASKAAEAPRSGSQTALHTLSALRGTAGTAASAAGTDSSTTTTMTVLHDVGNNPRMMLLCLLESAAVEAAAACAQWAAQARSQTDDAATDGSAHDGVPPLDAPRWLHAREAGCQTLLEALPLPLDLREAVGGHLDESHARASLATVAVYLSTQAKFAYASLCEAVEALPASTTHRPRAANATLLLSVDDGDDDVDTSEDLAVWRWSSQDDGGGPPLGRADTSSLRSSRGGPTTHPGQRRAAPLIALKRDLWTRVAEEVRRARLSGASDPASAQRAQTSAPKTATPSATSPAQAVLATLLEAKNALVYATAAPSRTADRGLASGGSEADDDDDADGEEEDSVALQLAGPAVRAARRRQYVHFLLHATACVSSTELIQARSTLALPAWSEGTGYGSDTESGAWRRTRQVLASANGSTDPSTHAQLENELPHDLAHLRGSQRVLLHPYAAAVIRLLGEGDPLLCGAFAVHEMDGPEQGARSRPSTLFASQDWRTAVVTALSEVAHDSLAQGFTCLTHIQMFLTQWLLATTSDAANAEHAVEGNLTNTRTPAVTWQANALLPRSARLLSVLSAVAHSEDQTGATSSLHGHSPASATPTNATATHASATRGRDGDGVGGEAQRWLSYALRQQKQQSVLSVSGDGHGVGGLATATTTRTLLGRLHTLQSAASQLDVLAGRGGTWTDEVGDGTAAASGGSCLFTSVSSALAARLVWSPPSVAVTETAAIENSPAPTKPSSSSTPPPPPLAAAELARTLLTMVLGLSPRQGAALTDAPTMLRVWHNCVRHGVTMVSQLSRWLTPSRPAVEARTLLTDAEARLQTWLVSAMAAVRTAVQSETATTSGPADDTQLVCGAARSIALARVVHVLWSTADSLAHGTSAPQDPSHQTYASARNEAHQLFRTLHEPWRTLLRQDTREALEKVCVAPTLRAFVDGFTTWGPTDKTAASLRSRVWSDGYRTAHGQSWRLVDERSGASGPTAEAYPCAPSVPVEMVAWQVADVLHRLRQMLLPRTVSPSPSPLQEALARAHLDVAEAGAAVTDTALLPGLRQLAETIASTGSTPPVATATAATGTNPSLHRASAVAAAASALPRAELNQLVNRMTDDLWLQLYLDLSVWRVMWLSPAAGPADGASGSSSSAAATLARRLESLLRHCTLHGDATRWARVRPLLDEAVHRWQSQSGVLHGLAVGAAPEAASATATAETLVKDPLVAARPVERFALLPISAPVPLRQPRGDIAGDASNGGGSSDGGAGGVVMPTSALAATHGMVGALGAGGQARAGARRLANVENFASGGGGGGYALRSYAPPPPSAVSAPASGGVFVDLVSSSTAAATAGKPAGARSGVQDGVAGAAALWDQTQKGWSSFWAGGGGGASRQADNSSNQTL